MRTLAIDLGTRRVGIALSDEGGTFATPIDVLVVNAPEACVDAILKLIRQEDVRRIVLGLPLNMDGTLGPAARGTIVFGRKLAEQAGRPVIFVDERLSSFEAEQQLISRKRAGEKLTRQGKKRQLDALAAAGFLQAFLDGHLAAIDVGG